jgi:basic membrane lipoprotein Med (substrate-binding protein (PBP1-ABC) superfamily)
MSGDSVTLKGKYFATLYGPDGKIKDQAETKNVVTTVGKNWLGAFLASAAAAASTNTAKYAVIGTDPTGALVGNTALGVEAARHTGTVSYVTDAIYQVTATFAAGSGTGDIVEYGIYTTNTGGTLISRATKSAIAKGASDTLTVVFQLTLS